MATRIKIPGVFIQEIPNPSLTRAQEGVLTAAIVGAAKSTFVVNSVEVVRTAGTDTITGTTTAPIVAGDVASIISISDYIGVPKYVETTDFTIADNVITWVSGNKPTLGATYYVSLNQNKSSAYYEPILFTNIEDVRANYGYELEDGVLSEITAAAKLMFDSGAARVMVVQSATAGESDVEAALDKLQKEDVQVILIPGITLTAGLQTYLKTHVDNMSSVSLKKERIGFIAPLAAGASTTVISAQSASMADERIINIAPSQVNVTFKDNVTKEDVQMLLSSAYAGASLAGRLVNPNVRIATPLTRKVVTGVDDLNSTKYLQTEIETMAGSGTCVLYTDSAGNVKVNQGLTTDVSNANTSEISVVMIKDELRRVLRDSLEGSFIGTEMNTTTTPQLVASAVVSILETQKGRLLSAYRNVSARINLTDPTAVDVSMEVAVIRPLNYINISFTVYI